MRWWWGLWLATNFIGNASFRIELQAETIQSVAAAALLDIVSAIVSVPLALLLIRLIRDAHRGAGGPASRRDLRLSGRPD